MKTGNRTEETHKQLSNSKKKLISFIMNRIGWSSGNCNLRWSNSICMLRCLHHLKLSNCAGHLLPTPTTGNNRNSRNAVLKIGEAHKKHGVALGLAQVQEITVGILPKEFDSWIQVPAFYKRVGACPPDRYFYFVKDCHFLNPLFVQQMMGFPNSWIILPFISIPGKKP